MGTSAGKGKAPFSGSKSNEYSAGHAPMKGNNNMRPGKSGVTNSGSAKKGSAGKRDC